MRAILTFHSIDDSGGLLSFPPAAFERLLDGLTEAGLPILDLDELLAPTTASGVAITFDDGLQSVLTTALPMLRDRAASAHLFIATGAIGVDDWPHNRDPRRRLPVLSWEQIDALHAGGIRIESHTHSHPDLRILSDDAILSECVSADQAISERLGRRPRYLAYPFGLSDERVRELLRSRYAAALTTDLRPLRRREDPAALPRLDGFYLRGAWMQTRFSTGPGRMYLALRHAGRRLRQVVEKPAQPG